MEELVIGYMNISQDNNRTITFYLNGILSAQFNDSLKASLIVEVVSLQKHRTFSYPMSIKIVESNSSIDPAFDISFFFQQM